jgi:hypothetical protein
LQLSSLPLLLPPLLGHLSARKPASQCAACPRALYPGLLPQQPACLPSTCGWSERHSPPWPCCSHAPLHSGCDAGNLGRWKVWGAHTGHAQVRIKLGCLANAPACMMGWVTHTSTLEQLILQDLSLSLHWSCKCCSACKILLSEFQTQAEHHRLPASRRARAVAKEASLAAERLQKMTLHDGCPRALNCARTHARTRARTHTHAHTNAHTRTNTHTHMRAHN